MFQVGSVFIPVTDIEKSKSWYEDNLGVNKIGDWSDGFEKGAGYCFPTGSTQLGLVQVEKTQQTEFVIRENKKNVYFNFVVEDIEMVHTRLKSNGVTTTDIEDFGSMKGFEFFDPDGNPFSVVNEDPDSPFHTEQVAKLQETT